MPPLIDLSGQQFGRLTVVRLAAREEWTANNALWICECECGATTRVLSGNLRKGNTQSCGCLRRDSASSRISKRNTTHGHARHAERSPTYLTWVSMLARCNNPRHDRYQNYGGRGITICERRRIFENFLTDMGERPPDLTLDRIDPNGNYEPGNCRWATRSEQNRNRRTNVVNP